MTERRTWPQDPPFPKINVGRACLYDGVPCIVTEEGEGPFGPNVTFKRSSATITTSPGLDDRFAWP